MVTGIICELDPLHNGHSRLLSHARALGGDAVVCALSGNFTQRGSFAALDKRARAEMALRCGADLVLELPVVWAMSPAESFARGGVSLLTMAGADTLLFGSESGELGRLRRAAEALDSPAFSHALRSQPEDGRTFAARRQAALASVLGEDAALLSRPNNILAVEYLRAICHTGSSLQPRTLRRQGAGHDGAPEGDTASASYLRELIRQGRGEDACAYMPPAAADILRREIKAGRITDETLCQRALLACLRTMTAEDWQHFDTGGEGLCRRMAEAGRTAPTVEAFLEAVRTKRYPLSRLRRMLLAAWLRLVPPPAAVPYLRVLGANETGRHLLRALRDGGAPVLTKPADVAALGPEAAALFALESRCTDLYLLARPALEDNPPGQDYRTTPLMV